MTPNRRHRPGTSFLEIQVALIVLAIAMAGLCPLVVMQAKLLRRIENAGTNDPNPQLIRGVRIINGQPFYGTTNQQPAPAPTVLVPQPDSWVRRLGVAATFRPDVPTQTYTQTPISAMTDDDAQAFTATGWSTSTDAAALGGGYHWLAAGNTTASQAVWSFPPSASGWYTVFVRYVPNVLNARDATYSFVDSRGVSQSVSVDQTVAPNGPNDIPPYKSLGEFYLAMPSLPQFQFNLGPSMTGRVIADAVQLVPVPANAVVVTTPAATTADGAITATVEVTLRQAPGP